MAALYAGEKPLLDSKFTKGKEDIENGKSISASGKQRSYKYV